MGALLPFNLYLLIPDARSLEVSVEDKASGAVYAKARKESVGRQGQGT